MTEFFSSVYSWVSFLPRINGINLFEIIIIAFLVYSILVWIKNTRAWTLLKGILIIMAFALFAVIFRLDTILWIFEKTATIAVTAVIIIFQPEMRTALEQLGRRRLLVNILPFDINRMGTQFMERTQAEIIKAVFEMAKVKTGALIVIERNESLREIERTGIGIDGLVTSQLLINIFEHNTPLHDGAVIIRGDRIAAATCYLPLSDNMEISKELGTRHRAAQGVSETTDGITIVVSEETGRVSVAEGGVLVRIDNAEELKSKLSAFFDVEEGSGNGSRFKIWKGKRKNERVAD